VTGREFEKVGKKALYRTFDPPAHLTDAPVTHSAMAVQSLILTSTQKTGFPPILSVTGHDICGLLF
jgi:hypothetical protein